MSTIERALQRQAQKRAAQEQQQETIARESGEFATPPETIPAEAQVQSSASSRTDKPVIDLTKLGEGFIKGAGRHLINEEYQAIKRKILNNAFGPLAQTLTNSNIVMVTSPNPNEGKTFTAMNLAMSIALEQDKTVLLVDADVLRPSILKILGLPTRNGLMEYLLGQIDDLSEVIYNTSLETLRILPAGQTHHLSNELLASERMLETVNEFSTRYPDRIVIFDTPPLLGINETAVLANLAGQGVVVVREGKTSLNDISQAVEQLSPNMAKGFVINRAKRSNDKAGGYYGYYYSSEKKDD